MLYDIGISSLHIRRRFLMVYFSDILYRLNRPLEESRSNDPSMIWPCKVLQNFDEAQVSREGCL